MNTVMRRTAILISTFLLFSSFGLQAQQQDSAQDKGLLQIHYINLGQGGSTLIIGPDGTTILYDFGVKQGKQGLVPYLDSVLNGKQIDYAILSHRDKDHFVGYKDLIEAGYDISVANYEPDGPPKDSPQFAKNWTKVTPHTRAGAAKPIPVGLAIAIGNGASILVASSNGRIFDGTDIAVSNENDRSISLFLNYGKFQYILDGDLGGGEEKCSGHETTQLDIQTYVAKALLKTEKIDPKLGVDVFHVAHHGSESSSPARYVNLINPEVGLISVGNPNCSYRHPRKDVISMLLGKTKNLKNACSNVIPLTHVFQTDYGSENCARETVGRETDNSGIISGDIVLRTDGKSGYQIKTSGFVWEKKQKIQKVESQSFFIKMDESQKGENNE
jgi:beta-lactamase superfamily II metal-dependent hydrolase